MCAVKRVHTQIAHRSYLCYILICYYSKWGAGWLGMTPAAVLRDLHCAAPHIFQMRCSHIALSQISSSKKPINWASTNINWAETPGELMMTSQDRMVNRFAKHCRESNSTETCKHRYERKKKWIETKECSHQKKKHEFNEFFVLLKTATYRHTSTQTNFVLNVASVNNNKNRHDGRTRLAVNRLMQPHTEIYWHHRRLLITELWHLIRNK